MTRRQAPASVGRIARALLGAIVILVLIEIGLRLLMPPAPPWQPAPFQPGNTGGLVRHILSPDGKESTTTWLRQRYVAPQAEEGTFRIVVCGSSAIYGYGSPLTGAPPWQLERALQRMIPTQTWEVINLGQQGSWSTVHARNLRDALRELSPNLMIVMMGNNEFLPLMAYRSIHPDYDARADLAAGTMRRSRIHALLSGLIDRLLPPPRIDDDAQARRIGLEQIVDGDEALVEAVYRRNLEDMCDACREAGVPLVLCTVPVNRCWPPFALNMQIMPLPSAVRREWEELQAQRMQGRAAETLPRIEALDARLTHPQLRYERGMCLLAMGRTAEAKEALDQAMQMDRHPRRADPRFAAIVRSVGREKNVPVCDVAEALDASVPNGVPGSDEFLDACHFTPRGARTIARLWADFLSTHRLVPASGTVAGKQPSEAPVQLSLEDWPGYYAFFSNPRPPSEMLPLRDLALRNPQARYFSDLVPPLDMAHATSADLLRVYGHILASDDHVDDALVCYQRALALTPRPSPSQYFEAGLMAFLAGRFGLAHQFLVQGDPADPIVRRLTHLTDGLGGMDTTDSPMPTTVPSH